MGKGGQNVSAAGRNHGDKPLYTWDEVKKHRARDDKWIVINNQVYNITNWSQRHPGGSKVISHYAGQDATEAFNAFHNDPAFARKYMKAIHVGSLDSTEADQNKHELVQQDFAELRETAQKMGLFRPSVCFFVLSLLHIIAFEVLAYVTLAYFGTGWIPYIVSVLCYTIVQGQASWSQHDYGHLSVFRSRQMNHALHLFLMNFTKGAASHWWNHMHYQHHAKPNVMDKDPDVRLDVLFVLGDEQPKRVAQKKKTSLPYNWQHRYFFAIGPPLLFPLYFQFMIFKHTISRRQWLDLFCTLMFYVKVAVLYYPLLGGWGTFLYYLAFRCLESHWFVWVAQSNHIPMEISEDKERPWLPLQLHATCNVEKTPFNDWFTGHLNFQIEHHLFPTMPRHNLYKIAPLVRSLCEKHHVPYQVKTLGGAFSDIVKSLKHSGELWHHYYQAYQLG